MIYKLPCIETKSKAVILANGNFPNHPIPLSILYSNKEHIICCDGAIDSLIKTGIVPHAIVGDCDSLSEHNKIRFANIIHQVHEQDTNDLTKSVVFCIENNIDEIIILGATGRREDHTIANIGLLADYVDSIDNVSIVTDYGVFNVISKTSNFESFVGQQVSLFSVSDCIVTTQNLKYSINKRSLKKWWEATLNESLASNFIIETDDKLIVYRVF